MNLLFWNLHGNGNEKIIADIISENEIDIALFTEHEATDWFEVFHILNGNFHKYSGPPTAKTMLICKNSIDAIFNFDAARFSIFSVGLNSSKYIIVGVHLTAFPQNKERRKLEARNLVNEVKQVEQALDHTNTVLIGDFNANPFDTEMILKDGLNAVLFKSVIVENEFSKVDGKKNRRFYNPMLHYISESKAHYGSIYHAGDLDDLYWNSYDQVLVRKSLIELLVDVRYLKQVRGRSLLKRLKPSSDISDHLPLIVSIKETE